MKKIVLIFSLLMLIGGYGFAQCNTNEVEVRIEVLTDEYGSETYWTLSDIIGNVILQGGQNGVYANNFNHVDSVCVLADDCLFFDIFDGYGDGIFDPGNYRIYVNDQLVITGNNDFGSRAFEIVN